MVALIVGIIWMFVLGVQMRLLARRDASKMGVFWITFVASLVYCYVVRQVNISDDFILWYSVGSSIGAVGSLLPLGKVVPWLK